MYFTAVDKEDAHPAVLVALQLDADFVVVDHALKGRAAQRALVVQTVPAHGRNLGVSLCSARMRDFAPGRKPRFQDDNHPQDRPARTRR
jgi:hypothetical protein